MTENRKASRPATYSSYTYDAQNAIKRALHRNRYRNILNGLKIGVDSTVLDYGAGDGRLFRILIDEHEADPKKLVAFDPVATMREQFCDLVPEASIYGDIEEIVKHQHSKNFDFIFCCEVFEHLTHSQIEAALTAFTTYGGLHTVFLIEVPIEIGPSGLLKNLYRRFKSKVDIPVPVLGKALLGIEQLRKSRVLPNGDETYEHPGYSFNTARSQLSRVMNITSEFNDPFRRAPFLINNSRIFVGKLR